MQAYQLLEVKNSGDATRFADVARYLYRNDAHWVAPLDRELAGIFSPQKNTAFQQGEAARWVLTTSSGELAGRIAAFVHRPKASRYEQPTGGIGFFECVDDVTASRLLFSTAQAWLTERGMQAMDGPVNFGENDRYTGLLVQGFTQPGFGMLYNPPYYEHLFLDYGFNLYFEQVSKHLDITQPIPARFEKIARWVAKRPGVRLDYLHRTHIQQYIHHFQEVYNDAWQHHEHFTPMTDAQAQKSAQDLKPILFQQFMIYAYVHDEPAGFLFCLPDLNQIFKPLRGKFSLWQKLLFLYRSRKDLAWYRKRGILTRGRVIIIGVKPKFQKLGLESAMALYSWQDGVKAGFKEIELGWVGDFNPLSRNLQEATGAHPGKVHRTYRYLFDPSKAVSHAPSLGLGR